MLSLLFAFCMIWFIGKFLIFGVKASWGIMKLLCTVVFFPVILIGLVVGGLLAVYCFSIAVDSRNHSTGSITFIVFGNYSEGSIPRGILNRNCEGTEQLQYSKNQT